jgi:hypothetical protein
MWQLALGRARRCAPFGWLPLSVASLTSSDVRKSGQPMRAFRDSVLRGRRARERVRQGERSSTMDGCLSTHAAPQEGAGWEPSVPTDQVPFEGCGMVLISPSSEREILHGTGCSALLPWVSPPSLRWSDSWPFLVRPEFHGLEDAPPTTRRKHSAGPCLPSRPNLRRDCTQATQRGHARSQMAARRLSRSRFPWSVNSSTSAWTVRISGPMVPSPSQTRDRGRPRSPDRIRRPSRRPHPLPTILRPRQEAVLRRHPNRRRPPSPRPNRL